LKPGENPRAPERERWALSSDNFCSSLWPLPTIQRDSLLDLFIATTWTLNLGTFVIVFKSAISRFSFVCPHVSVTHRFLFMNNICIFTSFYISYWLHKEKCYRVLPLVTSCPTCLTFYKLAKCLNLDRKPQAYSISVE